MSNYDDPEWYEQAEQPEQLNASLPLQQPPTYHDKWPVKDPQTDNLPFQPPTRPSVQRNYDDSDDKSRRLFRQVAISLILIIFAFLGGWFTHQAIFTPFNPGDQSRYYDGIFTQAWNLVDQNYVDRKAINYKSMSYEAIRAMLAVLKDTGHTRFLTPEDVQTETQSLNGKFVGIGITLDIDATTKLPIITSTISGAPAEKAHLQRGDLIVAVDGTSTSGKDLSGVRDLIRGSVNTSVSLTIQRPSTHMTFTVKLVRAEIAVPNVVLHYIAEEHIAHIQIAQFASGISNQLKDALNQAKQMGATKIILDLRNDPGGYLSEAIDTASAFLKSGNVLLEQDSTGNRTPYPVNGNPINTTDAIVVLVNKGTASAAEIVSGALKDNHRATILGQTTFGTGTVLNEFGLADGSAILLGTQEWLTPNGQFIRDHGIDPDVSVSLSTGSNPLTPGNENSGSLTEQQILKSGDTQLIQAIQYLNTHPSPSTSNAGSQGSASPQPENGQLAYEYPLWDANYNAPTLLNLAA